MTTTSATSHLRAGDAQGEQRAARVSALSLLQPAQLETVQQREVIYLSSDGECVDWLALGASASGTRVKVSGGRVKHPSFPFVSPNPLPLKYSDGAVTSVRPGGMW